MSDHQKQHKGNKLQHWIGKRTGMAVCVDCGVVSWVMSPFGASSVNVRFYVVISPTMEHRDFANWTLDRPVCD